jgi:hypothetical protein
MPNALGRPIQGYVGWVRFFTPTAGTPTWLRATSADLKASQNIEKPDVVDGKTDRTVYQLGPMEVGGGVSFPAIYELNSSTSQTPAEQLWTLGLVRKAESNYEQGGDLESFNTDIKYTTGTGFKYIGCAVNTIELTVDQGGPLNVNLNVIGINRTNLGIDSAASPDYQLRNTRIVTWNDTRVGIKHPTAGFAPVTSANVRTFSVSVNNNIQRYYSLNGQLFPVAILPTKREITGSISFLGRANALADYVFQATGESIRGFNVIQGNQTRCTEKTEVWFGYQLSATSETACTGQFYVKLPGCVFQVEEMSITNDIFQTTMAYHSLPGIEYGSEGRDTTFVETVWGGGDYYTP